MAKKPQAPPGTPRHNLSAEERRRGAAAGGRARAAKLRRENLDAAVRRLATAAERAAETVEQLLDASDEAVRLRAALGLLRVLDEQETAELASRLERLETSLNGGS
jgi:glycosyltransferase A (GT-A) superfamily protein (DUF2064 family)